MTNSMTAILLGCAVISMNVTESFAGIMYRSSGTAQVVEGGTTVGLATYDDGLLLTPTTPVTHLLTAGPSGSNVNGLSSFTFMQTRDGDAEVFSWTTTLERQAAIEGAFLYTNVVLNIAAAEALTYTFDAQWSGLSTFGNPYYLATAQGPGYISFLDENHIVPLQSGSIGAGTIDAGSWNLQITNYIHSGSFGPRPGGLGYPGETAVGVYTLRVSSATVAAVPEPSGFLLCFSVCFFTIAARAVRKQRANADKNRDRGQPCG